MIITNKTASNIPIGNRMLSAGKTLTPDVTIYDDRDALILIDVLEAAGKITVQDKFKKNMPPRPRRRATPALPQEVVDPATVKVDRDTLAFGSMAKVLACGHQLGLPDEFMEGLDDDSVRLYVGSIAFNDPGLFPR